MLDTSVVSSGNFVAHKMGLMPPWTPCIGPPVIFQPRMARRTRMDGWQALPIRAIRAIRGSRCSSAGAEVWRCAHGFLSPVEGDGCHLGRGPHAASSPSKVAHAAPGVNRKPRAAAPCIGSGLLFSPRMARRTRMDGWQPFPIRAIRAIRGSRCSSAGAEDGGHLGRGPDKGAHSSLMNRLANSMPSP